jgi:hypothetical protein
MAKRVAIETEPMISRRDRLQGLQRLRRRRNLTVAPVGRTSRRSYRQTITKVDLWSVLKISTCFYLGALVVVLAAAIGLWEIARVAGVVDSIQHFMRQLLGSNNFTFLSWRLLRGFTLVGIVVVCLAVVITVVAAAFYNLFAEIMGGVVITVVEEDEGR